MTWCQSKKMLKPKRCTCHSWLNKKKGLFLNYKQTDMIIITNWIVYTNFDIYRYINKSQSNRKM